jgi:hypothetical protein
MTSATEMGRLRSRGVRGDAGAYGIIYGLILLLIVGTAGLVLDLAALRQDRRLDRAAADAGAVAGASALTRTINPNPQAACRNAWRYVLANIGATSASGSETCAGTFPAVPGDPGYNRCPASDTTMAGTISQGGVTVAVRITWPVHDSSALMAPDVRPANASVTQQVVGADGNACKRVGVEIARPRTFNFVSALGIRSGGTSNHSVAVSAPGGGGDPIASPLVILDPTACSALQANGGAQVLIAANDTLTPGVPGLIAVNSDGTQCTGQGTTVDSNASSGNNTHIWANDSVTGGAAQILTFAQRGKDYKDAQTTGCVKAGTTWSAGQLCPTPDQLLSQISRFSFIDNTYNCVIAQTCTNPTDPANGVAQFKSYVEGLDVAMIANPATRPAGWTYVTGSECSSPASSYTGNVYVDCTGNGVNGLFTVSGTTVFSNAPGGGQSVVVFAGDVKVNGCLVINGGSSECTTPTLTPKSADGPLVYLTGGLTLSATNSSFIAPQTFVYQGRCATDGTGCRDLGGAAMTPSLGLQTGGTGSVMWSAPLAAATTCVPGGATSAPTSGCFSRLALWGEIKSTNTSSEDSITGGANLLLQGTFFTPNAQFNLHGGAFTDIRSAQFVTGRLNLTGQGTLTMVPDAAKTNPPPLLFAELIR